MIDAQSLIDALRDRYKSGETQQEISEKTSVARSYICDLLSGKKKADGLTLKKINQLFPHAELSLGNRSIGNSNIITNSRVQSDNNFLPAAKDIYIWH